MKTATILGAGYMGAAMSFPLSWKGISARLWGTWLDDDLIEASKHGAHPRLKTRLPETVSLHTSTDIEAALEGTDMLFLGVSSEGVSTVLNRALQVLDSPVPIFCLTKGFATVESGVHRISQFAKKTFSDHFPGEPLSWTSIGGPVKAFELARGVPSAAVYASKSSLLADVSRSIESSEYRVRTTSDVTGVELCSAFKNVFAVAIGLCDGLYSNQLPGNYHNLSSLLFTQALVEMARIVESDGGTLETVYEAAGVGDLCVTARSGKNQRFGELVGSGLQPEDAYQQMDAEGQLAEGYIALKAGAEWLSCEHPELDESQLPLFYALFRITHEGASVKESIEHLVASYL